MSRTYTVVIEEGPTNCSAYILELPGCIAAAESRDEVKRLIVEAGAMHIQAMLEQGEELPAPVHVSREEFQLA